MKLFKFIQRKRALGDVLWMEPVIRQLAADYRFVFVNTAYTDLFRNYPLKNVHFREKMHPLVKLVRETSKLFFRSAGFINLDNAYEKSPEMHVLQAYFNTAGYPAAPLSYPRLYPEKSIVGLEKKKYVVMHLSAPSKVKNFRTIGGIDWIHIKSYLETKGYEVVGLTDDLTLAEQFTRITSPAVSELISLIDGCAFFIGLDSGPSHIAAALQKPCILFFGSVNPAYRHILSEFNGLIMQQPCVHAGCYHKFLRNDERKCLIEEHSAIAPCCRFTTGELIQAIDKLIIE